MRTKLILLLITAGVLAGFVYLGVSWSDRRHKLAEAEKQIKWQEARYHHLVDRARGIQTKLEEQQALTRQWHDNYNALASRGPEIRERTKVVVERVPQYLDPQIVANRADEALWGLAQIMTVEIAPMVETGDEEVH